MGRWRDHQALRPLRWAPGCPSPCPQANTASYTQLLDPCGAWPCKPLALPADQNQSQRPIAPAPTQVRQTAPPSTPPKIDKSSLPTEAPTRLQQADPFDQAPRLRAAPAPSGAHRSTRSHNRARDLDLD